MLQSCGTLSGLLLDVANCYVSRELATLQAHGYWRGNKGSHPKTSVALTWFLIKQGGGGLLCTKIFGGERGTLVWPLYSIFISFYPLLPIL